MTEEQMTRAEAALDEATALLDRVQPTLRSAFAGALLKYLLERPTENSNRAAVQSPSSSDGTSAPAPRPRDLADLYQQCNPESEPERALVAGYWIQEVEATNPFEAQAANDALKRLGYPVSNITRALGVLAAGRPQLIMQVEKSGRTKQARKKYRVTDAGMRTVSLMQSKGANIG